MNFSQRIKAKGIQNPDIAYIFALIAYTLQAFGQILFKYLAHVITPHQILFYRGIVLISINSYTLRMSKLSPYIHKDYVLKLILTRLIFSTAYVVMAYCSVKYLPVSTVSSLSNTSPIFIFFIQAIYFKKGLNKTSLMLTVVSFIGIILIIKPDFIFSSEGLHDEESFMFYSIMVLIGAFSFAMTMIFIHQIASFHIGTLVNMHYSYIGHLFLTSIMANFSAPSVNVSELSITHLFSFVGVVVFAMATQFSLFTANTLKKPSYTMPLGYVGVILSFLSDVYFFNIQFDFLSIVGMILTSVGLLSKYLLGQEQQKEHRAKSYKIQDFLNEQPQAQQSQQKQKQLTPKS